MPRRNERRPRGDGAVFFSSSKGCWIWRAVTGHKPDGSVQYTEGRARTQADAVARKRAAEAASRQPDAKRETVGDHLSHWLEDVARPNVRPSTWTRYENVVRIHLRPRIGGIALRKLTVAHVTKLWGEMSRDEISPGTIKKVSEVLASALECAVTEQKIPTAPTRNARKPKVIRPDVEVFTDEEIRSIITTAADYRLGALVILGVATGAREGELFALDPDDFDDLRGSSPTVRITKMVEPRKGGGFTIHPPKSKSGLRTVSLPKFAAVAVADFIGDRKTGPAFPDTGGSYLLCSNFLRRDWTGLLEAAGVPYRKFHALRHTHASRLLAAGVDPAEVARRLGDRLETVMRVYAHWVADANRDTAGKVEAIYGRES